MAVLGRGRFLMSEVPLHLIMFQEAGGGALEVSFEGNEEEDIPRNSFSFFFINLKPRIERYIIL